MQRAQLVFAAQTLIEYQARQALQAGADQIFVMVDAVTPAYSRLVDRLASDGAHVHLVRDMAGLIRQLPRESDFLLFADGMVVDQKYVMDLAGEEGNGLLTVADDGLTATYERVDASHRWAGVARIAPRTLFNTLDLIGDWDLVLTLLRAVVQNDPRRVPVAVADVGEGRVAMIDSQAAADLAGGSLARPADAVTAGAGAERYILRPLGHFVARRLMRMQIAAAHIVWTAIGIGLLGLLSIVPGWSFAALLLFLLALAVDQTAAQVSGMGRHATGNDLVAVAPVAIVALGIGWLGTHFGVATAGLHLGILCAVSALLAARGKIGAIPPWAVMTPGSALILLFFGLIVGRAADAVAVGALLAILSLSALLLLKPEPNAERPLR